MNSRRNRDLLEPMKVGDHRRAPHAAWVSDSRKLETRTDSKVKTFEEARGDIANRIGDQKLRGERESTSIGFVSRPPSRGGTPSSRKYETALARRHQASESKSQASTTN